MSNVPYFQSMSDFEPLTPSKVAALANAVQTLYQQPINDKISLTGTTAATTKTYLDFGYNVITTATATNNACRLPNPPIKGRSTVIVNNSGFPIVVYPSVTGGSINGVVNGSALVPSDGKPYTFFCYENPLPGAWSWTPPATNQYDSGEIVIPNLTSPQRFMLVDSTNFAADPNYISNNTIFSFDGLNKSFINPNPAFPSEGITGGIISKFLPGRNATKIKIYSNRVSATASFPFTWFFTDSTWNNYYEPNTTNFLGDSNTGNGEQTAGTWAATVVSGAVYAQVPGTPLVANGYCSPNIGDPGTWYCTIDLLPGFSNNLDSTLLGDKFMGQKLINNGFAINVLVDVWQTRYTALRINTINFTSIGAQTAKIRFFIEYN